LLPIVHTEDSALPAGRKASDTETITARLIQPAMGE
jgi:hypothetical protein